MNKGNISRKLRGTIGWVIFLVTIAIGNHFYNPNGTDQQTIPTVQSAPVVAQTPAFTPSPTIAQYGSELGIPYQDLQASHASIGDTSDCNIAGEAAAGCTEQTGNTAYITIASIGTPNAQRTVLAYEFLHWVWEVNTDSSDKSQLTTLLMQVYNNNRGVRDYLNDPFYQAEKQRNPDSFVDELHSIVGTYVSDSEIPQPLLAHYESYLPNRNTLPSYY